MILRRSAHSSLGRIARRAMASKEMAYSEKRLIGFSREEMFEVVSNVERYHEFIPWCRSSTVERPTGNSQIATLEIGFPPFSEKYKSKVLYIKPSVVHSSVIGSDLFRTLDTTFRFGKGKEGFERSCQLHYDLTFEFQSEFHSRIAHLFFDKVVKTMVSAFLNRAAHEFGPPTFPHLPPNVLKYKS
ncbi:unnamed protein product [Caenorhabditis bovis]|uniref:Coenzyme Q-binding protein COQ10 START domain-containing protein n=1 Tax=Caenorhabditis bovis TaxID=2654633 RepID=A0A8S1EHE9_9PELO|nr:unnamed protein product [Caenorhabditis bovis]